MASTTQTLSDLLQIQGKDHLHIGGKEAKEGWKLLNIQAAAGVDYVGDIRDLSQFPDASFDAIYSSHVLEHVGYQKALGDVLKSIHRILRPGGNFWSVSRTSMSCAACQLTNSLRRTNDSL